MNKVLALALCSALYNIVASTAAVINNNEYIGENRVLRENSNKSLEFPTLKQNLVKPYNTIASQPKELIHPSEIKEKQALGTVNWLKQELELASKDKTCEMAVYFNRLDPKILMEKTVEEALNLIRHNTPLSEEVCAMIESKETDFEKMKVLNTLYRRSYRNL